MSSVEIDLDNPDFDLMEQDIAEFASVPSVNEVLLQGTDLKNYYQQIAKELAEAEQESIADYVEEREESNSLHEIIVSCDSELESIEELLTRFKGSLGQLSTDICTLQAKSQSITTQLGNRKNLEKEFGEFTRNISLPNEFIQKIMSGEIDQNYVEVLKELHDKLMFIKKPEVMNTQSALETKVPLNMLRVKASINIRNWLVDRVNELKICYGTEQANIQQRMMKCKFLIGFLKTNSPDIEQTVRDYYVRVMARIYRENFRMLTNRLKKQMNTSVLANETIVPVAQAGFWRTKKVIKEASLFFSIGEREKLLSPIICPPQSFGDGTYHVEAFIKSLYQILIDTVTVEHSFASEFFMNDSVTINIFMETFGVLETFMKDLLSRINDPICIGILLRFANAHSQEMQRRSINKVDSHLRNVSQMLTTRFREIIKANINAMTTVDPHLFLENKATCHFSNSMTQRFSEFALSMCKVLDPSTAGLFGEEYNKTARAFDTLMNNIALIISQETGIKEMKFVYLINNYYAILDKIGAIDGDFAKFFVEKNDDCQREFIDLVIESQFPDLMKTVKRAYASSYDQKERPISIDITEKELKDISVDFKDHHTSKAVQIIDSQQTRFDNLANRNAIGMGIIQRIAFVWTRFELLVNVNSPNQTMPQWWSQMTTANKLVEDLRPITKKLAPM